MNYIEPETLPESKSARYASRVAWIPIAGIPLYTFFSFYALYSIGKGKTGLFLLGKGLKRLLWINLVFGIIFSGFWFYPYRDIVTEDGIRGEGYSMRGFSLNETWRIRHWKFYDSQNRLKEEGNYSYGKKEGKWISYHPEGQIYSEEFYQDGKKEGLRKDYFPSGKKELEINFLNDKYDGKLVRWYENGQKREQSEFRDGLLNGKWTTWFPNGQIEMEGRYADGEEVGPFSRYDETGAKISDGSEIKRYIFNPLTNENQDSTK